MKIAIGCFGFVIEVVILLVVAVLIALLGGVIATVTVPLHSPEVASQLVCPTGTHLVSEWYQASWNHPGEKTLRAWCEDAQGHQLDTLPLESDALMTGIQIFFPYIFIPTLIIGGIILVIVNIMILGAGALIQKFLGAFKTSPA